MIRSDAAETVNVPRPAGVHVQHRDRVSAVLARVGASLGHGRLPGGVMDDGEALEALADAWSATAAAARRSHDASEFAAFVELLVEIRACEIEVRTDLTARAVSSLDRLFTNLTHDGFDVWASSAPDPARVSGMRGVPGVPGVPEVPGRAADSSAALGPGAVERSLTRREMEVLRLVSRGMSNGQIARRLFIGEGTVKSHVKAILRKLHASHRAEAVAIWLRCRPTG